MSESNTTAKTITLWTYAVGAWSDGERLKPLLDTFREETGIEVQVEALSYDTGDKRIRAVMGTEAAPDLVMEGPERLVADWGAAGAMVDLADMLDPDDRKELYRSVLSACTASDGAVYEYPLVRTVHCMAVNVSALRASNALQYVNLKKHTWTTDQFLQAIAALSAHYGDAVAAVYCGGQAGDQGTRALVTNLYDGAFTDSGRTRYTWDDPRMVKALETLHSTEGLYFDPFISGSEEINMFYRGNLKVAFCWNVARHINPLLSAPVGKTAQGDDITFMAFPSPTGTPRLYPGIWGLGIFRHEDPARTAAAKAFIRFICDSEHTREAVRLAGYFAVRTAIQGVPLLNLWPDSPLMREYNAILPYISDNNQITKGWASARTAWWHMLQKIGEGGDIPSLVARYVREANAAAR